LWGQFEKDGASVCSSPRWRSLTSVSGREPALRFFDLGKAWPPSERRRPRTAATPCPRGSLGAPRTDFSRGLKPASHKARSRLGGLRLSHFWIAHVTLCLFGFCRSCLGENQAQDAFNFSDCRPRPCTCLSPAFSTCRRTFWARRHGSTPPSPPPGGLVQTQDPWRDPGTLGQRSKALLYDLGRS
jgi:hypothetical protein